MLRRGSLLTTARTLLQRPLALAPSSRLLSPCGSRLLCAKPPADGGEKLHRDAVEEAAATDSAMSTAPGGGGGGGQRTDLTLQDHEGENLPPLAFEPGIAGAAQKGVSAIVIAFGAVAFGAIAWGASQALFPSAGSTGVIYSEAFDKVQQDPDVAYALGTPLRAYGADHGTPRGRRNTMERWELHEGGQEVSVVRFNVAGPQGSGVVQAQVPSSRSRGDFHYIIFENRRTRQLTHVLDNRADKAAALPVPEPNAPADLSKAVGA
jgi:import inner membrane translocase subunit TIM21